MPYNTSQHRASDSAVVNFSVNFATWGLSVALKGFWWGGIVWYVTKIVCLLYIIKFVYSGLTQIIK